MLLYYRSVAYRLFRTGIATDAARQTARCEYNPTVPAAITLHPLLAEVVRRVVATAHPDRILLFGSTARGDRREDSDFDLLVIKAGVASRRALAQRIYISLVGIPIGVDIVVVTPEDVKGLSAHEPTVLGTALSEAHEVYAA